MSSVSHHLSVRHRTVLIWCNRVQLASILQFSFFYWEVLVSIYQDHEKQHTWFALCCQHWLLTLYLPFVVMGVSTVLEFNSLVFFYYYFLLLLSKIVLVIWPTLSIEEIVVLFWKTSDTMLPKDRSHSWGQLNSDWTSPVLKLMLKHCDFKWRKTVYAYLYIKKYINCLWEVYLFIDKIVIIMI